MVLLRDAESTHIGDSREPLRPRVHRISSRDYYTALSG